MADTAAEAKRHNSTLPIHRLVAEVFIEIFLPDNPLIPHIPVHYCTRIRDIALASTTWATFVFESPTLWMYIHSRQSQNGLLNSLTRSKGCPSVVEYYDQPGED
ncbi:hypothetical protein FRB96_004486, partial [Tulasnella sp. 330]